MSNDNVDKKEQDAFDTSKGENSSHRRYFLQQLPLENSPSKEAPPEMTAAVIKCHDLRNKGFDLITHIRERREFENPNVLQNIVGIMGVDAFGSFLSTEDGDSHQECANK